MPDDWLRLIGVVPWMTLCCAADEFAFIMSCMFDVSIDPDLVKFKSKLEISNLKTRFSPIIGNSMALRSSSVCSSGTGAKRLFVKVLKMSAEALDQSLKS